MGLVCVLLAAFILRMALIIIFRTYAHPVAWEFEGLANHLLAGEGYWYRFLRQTYWSFATPLYPFLCAGVYSITNHSYFAVLLIQSLFTIALAAVIFEIAKTIFSERVGLLAATLVAFHPGFIYYDVFNLIPLSIDSFLIALITLLWLKYQNSPTTKRALLIGGLIGLATLSRGITGTLLLVVLFYFALGARGVQLKTRLRHAICLVCATFIVLAPWLIRNYIVQKQFVFIASTSGENFWRGNNRYATGTSDDERMIPIRELPSEDFRAKVFSMTEMDQQKFFQAEAFRFVRENPIAALKLYLKKVYYFWWFSPQSGTKYPKRYLAAYRYFYIVLISFFIAGLGLAVASTKKETREYSLILVSVPLVICLAQSVFYVEGRHRWLVEPLMMIFFSYGVLRSFRYLTARRTAHT